MKIVLLAEAQRRFEAEDEWWRENREAKDLFLDEFEQSLERIGSNPERGQAYRLTRGKRIQRVLMQKTAATSTTGMIASTTSSKCTRFGERIESAGRDCDRRTRQKRRPTIRSLGSPLPFHSILRRTNSNPIAVRGRRHEAAGRFRGSSSNVGQQDASCCPCGVATHDNRKEFGGGGRSRRRDVGARDSRFVGLRGSSTRRRPQ